MSDLSECSGPFLGKKSTLRDGTFNATLPILQTGLSPFVISRDYLPAKEVLPTLDRVADLSMKSVAEMARKENL